MVGSGAENLQEPCEKKNTGYFVTFECVSSLNMLFN